MPVCPSCGYGNAEGAHFCSACGTSLGAEAEQPSELRKTVTVLFGDLADSTGLGERLDPEHLRHVMSRYYGEMRSALEQHGGTVTKLMGDAVLAVFGIPVVHEDDALRAVTGACEMKRALELLNVELERELGLALQVKIAVNTGEVVVPDRPREEDFIVADVVNVAARLEQAATPGEILLGEGTYRIVRDAVRVELTDPLDLKGKARPVSAYRLLEVVAGAPLLAHRLDSPLVGRADELDVLRQSFTRAADECTCMLLTVLGSAGIGKSRLVQEFTRGLGGAARVVEGRCLPYGDGITFWPVAEIVREAAAISDEDSAEAARMKIAALVPEEDDAEFVAEQLAATLGLSRAISRPEEAFWAIRKLLEALAHERPLIVVFEDIHWGEETFLDLVEYLAGFTTEAPLLVISVARLDLLELRPSWSQAIEAATILPLRPLGEEETGELIRGLLGHAPLAEEAERPINSAAQGNPLFVEEMLRMLVDDGVLTRENGRWTQAKELTSVSTPPSIQALLSARIDRLDADERAVLERASIVGVEFWAGAVTALCTDTKRPAVWRHLQALVRKQLVRPGGTPFGGEDAFTFTHILIRDSAYSRILKETRAELHEHFADWLEQKAGGRIGEYEEILGYHLEQSFRYRQALGQVAEVGSRAAACLASAGRRAHARGDMPAAVKLLERSLSLQGKETEEGLELMLELSHALSEIELGHAYDLLGELAHAAAARGNRRLELRAAVERADLRIWTMPEVDLDELRRSAEEAVEAFRTIGDEVGMAKSLRNLATFHGFGGRWGKAGELLEQALLHARHAGDRQVAEEMLPGVAGALCVGPVPADDAIRRLQNMLDDVVEPEGGEGAPVVLSRASRAAVDVRGLAGLEAMRGHVDEARGLCARARRDLEEIGQRRRLADVAQVSGWIEMLAGAPAAAERYLRFSYETLEGMGETAVLSTVAAELAEALYVQGRYEGVEQLTDESAQLASRDDVESQVRWRMTRAKLLARSDTFEQAEALAGEAAGRAAETEYPDLHAAALLSQAEVLRLAGREDEATPIIARAVQIYEDKGNLVAAGRARGMFRPLS